MPTHTNHHGGDHLMPPHEEPHHHSFADSATLAVGATGAVVAADELLKMTDEDDKTASLLKAGVAAAVAIGAYELVKRAEEKGEPIYRGFSRSRSRSKSRSPSRHRSRSHSNASHTSQSSQVKHHKRHVLEEIIGAYSLGRDILGDRKHHVAHLLGEALGATGLIKELRARDKLDEEDRPKR